MGNKPMEAIKVIILESNRAREVNSFEKPKLPNPDTRKAYDGQMEIYDYQYNEWQESENNLREFEIDLSETFKMLKELENKSGLKISHVHVGHDVGSIHNAIVLENGKIRIV